MSVLEVAQFERHCEEHKESFKSKNVMRRSNLPLWKRLLTGNCFGTLRTEARLSSSQ